MLQTARDDALGCYNVNIHVRSLIGHWRIQLNINHQCSSNDVKTTTTEYVDYCSHGWSQVLRLSPCGCHRRRVCRYNFICLCKH